MQHNYTTRHLTHLLTTAALRAAPRRAWLALLIVAVASLTLAAAGLFTRYVRERLSITPPIYIIVATPVPDSAVVVVAPTAPPAVALAALWDYRDPASATTIDPARIACVVGTAESGAWQLIALDRCDVSAPRVWLAAGLLPDSVPIASDADLTPRSPGPAPALASEPGYRTYQAPAEQALESAATAAPPIFVLPEARDFGPGSRSGGSWECNVPSGC